MRPYCHETLQKSELRDLLEKEEREATREEQKIMSSNVPDEYYKYKLRGTIIHDGYVEFGHYYSYIQDRETEKWYEFNDS